MLSTGAIAPLSDTGNRNNGQWLVNNLYRGIVNSIHEDGSIEVVINNRTFQAQAHHSAATGDHLSLRLLGTEPEPHFSIVGILRSGSDKADAVELRAGLQEASSFLRKLEPGLSSLSALWQRYPEQVAKLSKELPGLLAALYGNTLASEELSKPGRIKQQILQSGLFYDAGLKQHGVGIDANPDLKNILFRLLQGLHDNRRLVLSNGRPVFEVKPKLAAQSLQANRLGTAALYASEQDEANPGSTLRQLLLLNAESALQQIINGQLQSATRTNNNLSIWIMQLMIEHKQQTIPAELEFRHYREAIDERWEVAFNLNLPKGGHLHAQIKVKKPAVSISLSCTNRQFADWLSVKGKVLQEYFAAQGLQLEHFDCNSTA